MEAILRPINEIEKSNDGWISTGADPQFQIDIQSRPCFLRVIFSGVIGGSSEHDDHIAKLYFDYGTGFHEENCIYLRFSGALFQFDELIPISRKIVGVRYDPMEERGFFKIERFVIVEQSKSKLSSIHDFRPLFIPTNQVENCGQNRWRSLGRDPYFHSSIATDAAALLIKVHIRVHDRRKTRRIVKTQIFFDYGDGYNEAHSYSFNSSTDEIYKRFTMATLRPIRGIRLDPLDRQCEFEIVDFRMTEISQRSHLAAMRAKVSMIALEKKGVPRIKLLASAVTSNASELSDLHQSLENDNAVPDAYQWWVNARGVAKKEAFFGLGETVKFSFILPTYNPPMKYLKIAINSIRSQIYGNWELCMVDDGSADNGELLRFVTSLGDDRVKLHLMSQNAGISAASNAALGMATGDFIVLMDQDDEIASHALSAVALAIRDNPEADWLYSDEDKISLDGKRSSPYFKPDWSPAFFLSCMYTCHLGVYRRSVVNELGGFRSEFDFAQDYDLALRISRRARKIVHVPDILYHWRMLPQSTASGADAKPTAEIRARAALHDFIRSGKYPGRVIDGAARGMHRPEFDIQDTPLVSIAIPSAGGSFTDGTDQRWFVLDLIRSIRSVSSYRNIEIVVADNGDFDPILTDELLALGVSIVHFKFEVFNLAEKMNFVVGATKGDYVVIMNDDMTVLNADWIEQMLMWCQQEDVAGVGAKLYFPDGKIQHAGVLMLGQGPSHPYYLHDGGEIGMMGNVACAHEASVVTGACMMIRRSDYIAVGGFDPKFRINYNDVDFCMRLGSVTGKRIIWTPFAEITHYESVSREDPPKGELEELEKRWGFGDDIYYNRHLSQFSNSYEIGMDVVSIDDDYGAMLNGQDDGRGADWSNSDSQPAFRVTDFEGDHHQRRSNG